MKRVMFLVVGIGVAISAILSFSSDLLCRAKAKTSKQPMVMTTRLEPSAQKEDNWQLGQPITYENLTIFPVVSKDKLSSEEFITLDEGLRAKTVKVTEIGATTRRT